MGDPSVGFTESDSNQMSLDLSKLERVRHRGRKTVARCPACAESEHDHRGEHLVINEDGKFGCVIYPGNSSEAKAHRKQIFALCGIREIQPLIVKKDASHSPKQSQYIIRSKRKYVPSVPIGTLGRQGRISTHTHLYTERVKRSEPQVHPLLKQSEPESVPGVPTAPVRKLKERTSSLYPCEVDWLCRWYKLGGDSSIILEAVRLFNAKIVRIERR